MRAALSRAFSASSGQVGSGGGVRPLGTGSNSGPSVSWYETGVTAPAVAERDEAMGTGRPMETALAMGTGFNSLLLMVTGTGCPLAVHMSCCAASPPTQLPSD